MKRTSVKSGLIDQRNRATQSRRERQILVHQKESKDELIEWLIKSKIDESDITSINLTDYLRCTQHFEIHPEERLRQLAIHIETEACSLPGEAGWQSLKRIYDQATKLNENDETVWLSMGISACEIADNLTNEKSKRTIFKAGEHAILNAMALRSNSSYSHYILGYLFYFQGEKQAALNEFEKSLICENEKQIHSWAQLYKAHCLHDIGNWEKALNSYNLVDLSAFDGHKSWRVDVLREQKAQCIYMIGRKEEAEGILIKILDRYEKEPKIAFWAMSPSLWELAKSCSDEIYERAKYIEQTACEVILS